MKRSNNKQKEMTAALYVRLSRDDNLEGDSYSIGTVSYTHLTLPTT